MEHFDQYEIVYYLFDMCDSNANNITELINFIIKKITYTADNSNQYEIVHYWFQDLYLKI